MENNVLSWDQALEKGYEPKLYPFQSHKIPLGDYNAYLDFKIWAKKIAGICCYFIQEDSGVKFQLTVYRRRADEFYKLEGSDIDFKSCKISSLYHIKVNLNSKGNVTFEHAAISQIL